MKPLFSQTELEAIAGALGDTDAGLKGTEIEMLIAACDNARRIMTEGERRILDRLGGDDRLARTVLQRLCD